MDFERVDDSTAPQACVACRRQKRKCDKAKPACSLCSRMSRPCDYSEAAPGPNADDFWHMRQRLADLEARLNGRVVHGGWHEPRRSVKQSPASSLDASSPADGDTVFPTLFFLDAELFNHAHMSIPKPYVHVPTEVSATLGVSALDIQDIVDRYFASIHVWLPFVSKKRMLLNLSNPSTELLADLALLVLAMKLVTHNPQEPVCTPLYALVKRYFAAVESSGLMSLRFLQADILIAVYEIGHAVYPAAYMTTGHCARLGHALGLHDRRNSPQALRMKLGAWTEVEEVKRTWWAIMLLDRYVSVGAYGHPLATEDAPHHDTLPADDHLWDEGEMTTSEPLYLSTPTTIRAGPFARTCQAGHLLGRLNRLLNDRVLDAPLRFTEAMQLHRTLQALGNLLPGDVQQSTLLYGTALALWCSAALHLYDPFACNETNRGEHTVEETEMQSIAIVGTKAVSADVCQFARLYQSVMDANVAATSPLVGDCIYMAAATYAWLVHESGSREIAEAYHGLCAVLKTLNARWRVGDHYLAALEKARETMYPDTSLL